MTRIRIAFRALAQSPFVTTIAVASLALGIGGNAAIFSLFEQMLLRALPVQEPERLVNLANPGPKPGSTSCGQAGDCDTVFSYPMFKDLEQAPGDFSGVAAHVLFDANLAADGRTESGSGVLVSGSYFPLLGLRPALGRLFGHRDEAEIGASFVVVLSHGYWATRLGADPDVLNSRIVVNGQSMTVVGVAPPGFSGTTFGASPDIFVPITMRGLMSPGFDAFEDRRSYWAYLFARMKPETTIERAATEINRTYAAIINEVEAPLQNGMSEATMERFRARRIELAAGPRGQSSAHAEIETPLTLLFSITGAVLLIACANIANLLLARGAARAQEMAIRGSLGASRWQLLRLLLAESCLLAVLGGVASLLVARWTLGILSRALPPESLASLTFSLRPSIVGFAGALSLATGLVFGLYPALQATRRDLVGTLRATAGQPAGARAASRFRTTLATAQLALSMTLLIAAGLFVKSLVNVSRVDLGLEVDGVVAFGISPELNGYDPGETVALVERAEETLNAIPGVTGVAAAMVAILANSSAGTSVSVEGFEAGPDVDNGSRTNVISAGYFRTMGIPLLAGREFSATDATEDSPVAIVNEAFARKFGLEHGKIVGARMARGGGSPLDIEIVGLVQDSKTAAVKETVPPMYYRPYRQTAGLGAITLYVRTAGDPEQIAGSIPAAITRIDPNMPIEDLTTLERQIRDNVFLDRMISSLSAAFATLATLLAAIGLYGVLSFTVAQRTREIGVRMALGADSRRVRAMVLTQVGKMTVIGGSIGLAMALLVGRAASSLLYGLEGNDPVVVVAVMLLLSAVALGAGYLPAARASRVDPMKALRFD